MKLPRPPRHTWPRLAHSLVRCCSPDIRQAERVGCPPGPGDTLAVVRLGLVVVARQRGREGR